MFTVHEFLLPGREEVLGVLMTKDLLLVDKDKQVPVTSCKVRSMKHGVLVEAPTRPAVTVFCFRLKSLVSAYSAHQLAPLAMLACAQAMGNVRRAFTLRCRQLRICSILHLQQ